MLDKLLYGGPGKIGSLENYEDAVEARLAAEEKVYGAFLKQYAEKKENLPSCCGDAL
ncbi:hypothetical protein AALB64_11695 [Lachnospiraceae bacterium 45-P1]